MRVVFSIYDEPELPKHQMSGVFNMYEEPKSSKEGGHD